MAPSVRTPSTSTSSSLMRRARRATAAVRLGIWPATINRRRPFVNRGGLLDLGGGHFQLVAALAGGVVNRAHHRGLAGQHSRLHFGADAAQQRTLFGLLVLREVADFQQEL